MTLENDILNLWADLFPIDGYKAGLPQCQGQLFPYNDESLHHAQAGIAALQARLSEIPDPDLRLTAEKLLRCFQAELEFSLPMKGVNDCAVGVHAILLKGDQHAPFVPSYLDGVSCMIHDETARWRGYETTLELRKLCLNSVTYLRETIGILCSENPDVSAACDIILKALADYEGLFVIPELENEGFEAFYALLQRQDRAAYPTPEYPRLLRDLYDYPETAESLHRKGLDWLEVEMLQVSALSEELARIYGLPDGVTTGQVWEAMDKCNAVGSDVLSEAQEMMNVADRYTAAHWLKIGPADHIEMRQTPNYLEPLGTEGSLMALDYLTPAPRYICYLTPSKNKSRLTMLNVLIHEYGHGYHASLTGRLVASPLLKIATSLKGPLAEAIAFHREWEAWEEAAALLGSDNALALSAGLNLEERDYLAIFGPDRKSQKRTIHAFELETRFWRIARFLRILGDVEIQQGLRTHIDFVEWAHDLTGLSKKFIHNAVFTFQKSPGYAPCYAIAGMRLGELQREAEKSGISRIEFDTRVSSIGYWPRTVYEKIIALPA